MDSSCCHAGENDDLGLLERFTIKLVQWSKHVHGGFEEWWGAYCKSQGWDLSHEAMSFSNGFFRSFVQVMHFVVSALDILRTPMIQYVLLASFIRLLPTVSTSFMEVT